MGEGRGATVARGDGMWCRKLQEDFPFSSMPHTSGNRQPAHRHQQPYTHLAGPIARQLGAPSLLGRYV